MPDRADYLARILTTRMRSLEELRADGADRPEHQQRRTELVEKVLAVEAGILDGNLHRTVCAALPSVSPGKAIPDRELSEFASFLRQRLPVET